MSEPSGTRRFPLKEAYAFGERHGLAREASEIRNMEIEWDRPYTSTVRRGRLIELFEARKLLDSFRRECWPYGATPGGQAEVRRCMKVKADYEAFLDGAAVASDDLPAEASPEFAVEAHLRDFLAKNLASIEPGLRLFERDGRSGVEFQVDGGRIDLLSVDSAGKYVVIELKLSQGRNKVLGQLLYYMGWVDQHLGNGPCRGIVVANEIGAELAMAVTRVPGVKLARYRMHFAIEWVTDDGAA